MDSLENDIFIRGAMCLIWHGEKVLERSGCFGLF